MRRALRAVAVLLALTAAPPPERAWQVPDRHNPWATLAVGDAPGWLTRFKLDRLAADPALCRAALATSTLDLQPLPDREIGPGCPLRDTVLLRGASWRIEPAVTLTCRATVSLALWERHVVLPQAQLILGRPVRRLEHYGSVACRNVNHAASGRRSQHASADALDVAGFVLDGGRRISVARDWNGSGAEGRFLRAVHAGGCAFFDGVLGPDYNAAHADHFHFDRGPYRVCR